MRATMLARSCAALVVTTACFTSVNAAASSAAAPQYLPSPYEFVSELDLECFVTDLYPPPTPNQIHVEHLNPELAHLPRDLIHLGEREQLCTPVAKSYRIPPDSVLEYIQYVDLSCYRARGTSINTRLRLTQLNPVLADHPDAHAAIFEPEHMCLPVIKNDTVLPERVLRLVQYIDLLCYREVNDLWLNRQLRLTQLNPEFRHLPNAGPHVYHPVQLCVPVRKNGQEIPDDVLRLVQWVDLEKFDMTRHHLDPPLGVRLTHINPLYADAAPERATLYAGMHLMVPVAKNHNFPPRG